MSNPKPVEQASNGLGIAGFVISLAGFFTGCLLCPLGFLLSLIALFRRPRGFAFAGLILGFIGSIIPVALIAIFGMAIVTAARHGMPGLKTFGAMVSATNDVRHYAATHGGNLPEDIDGQAVVGARIDGWGNPIQYHKDNPSEFQLRSAGPDGIFNTPDDAVEPMGLHD